MTAKQKWNAMSPEERVCDEGLKYLSEEILESDWDELALYTQDHLIILLSCRKEVNKC